MAVSAGAVLSRIELRGLSAKEEGADRAEPSAQRARLLRRGLAAAAVVLGVGTALACWVEGASFVDGVYWSVSACGSVGACASPGLSPPWPR